MANNLVSIGKLEDAHCHYLQASEMQREHSILDSMCTLQKAAYCKVYMQQYHHALKHLTTITDTIGAMVKTDPTSLSFSVASLRQSLEITTVLLLLLHRGSPLDSHYEQIMEKYTWESGNEDDNVLPEDLFLLVQSVVMAAQASDTDTLEDLEDELFNVLDPHQMDLLHRIVRDGTVIDSS